MIDARGHEVPGEGPDEPWLGRTHFRNLSDTINDIIPVANATAQAQLVQDLQARFIGPSAQRPLYVDRLDLAEQGEAAQSRILRTTDGSNWQALSGTDIYSANATAATFPASGGTLGVTATLSIPAEPWHRVVHVQFQAMATAVPSGSVQFELRRAGITGFIRAARTRAADTTVGGGDVDFLPAGSASSYQVVATATSAVVVPADSRFTFLAATVRPA